MIRASSSLCGAFFLAAGIFSAAAPASADPANLLGVFGKWSAYSTGSGNAMTCYAMSQPRASQPKGTKRNSIFLMVSDWPGRKIKAEPEVVPGYQYRDGAVVTLGIGGDKFNFFGRNDGKSGAAWLRSLNDGNYLIDVMKGGVSAVAIGTSTKGTKTTDTFSLKGVVQALDRVAQECK